MRTRLMVAMVIWTILAVSVAGCVETSGLGTGGRAKQSSAVSGAELVPERHDIAVTAVDTDPPWISKLVVPSTSVSLLAVVENKGNSKEDGVVVEASLYNRGKKRLLLHGVSAIEELSPGQSEVVRFGPFSPPSASSGYVLEVDAKPVPHEQLLTNNLMAFHILTP